MPHLEAARAKSMKIVRGGDETWAIDLPVPEMHARNVVPQILELLAY